MMESRAAVTDNEVSERGSVAKMVGGRGSDSRYLCAASARRVYSTGSLSIDVMRVSSVDGKLE